MLSNACRSRSDFDELILKSVWRSEVCFGERRANQQASRSSSCRMSASGFSGLVPFPLLRRCWPSAEVPLSGRKSPSQMRIGPNKLSGRS
jgi:hypothetical protein